MGRQDWQDRLKHRVSRVAHGTGRRPVLQAAYGGLIGVESAAAAAWPGRRGRGPVDPGTLTLVVKTFERPAVLRRMLASVRKVFAGPVVVADDSRTPGRVDDPRTTVLALPFDTGIGAGRNALLDAVETPYVFMTDDDMVLLADFDVTRAIDYLERNPQVDVVGGRVVHLPLWRTADYSSAALYAQRGEPKVRQGTLIDGLPVAYKVPNFYIARTASVRSIGYDDRLKRVDHNDFFTSAYGRLVCVVDPARAWPTPPPPASPASRAWPWRPGARPCPRRAATWAGPRRPGFVARRVRAGWTPARSCSPRPNNWTVSCAFSWSRGLLER